MKITHIIILSFLIGFLGISVPVPGEINQKKNNITIPDNTLSSTPKPDKLKCKTILEKNKKIKVKLKWSKLKSKSKDFLGYRIYKNNSKNFEYDLIANVTNNKFEMSGLDRKMIHRFRISSFDKRGNESPYTWTETFLPFRIFSIYGSIGYVHPMFNFEDFLSGGFECLLDFSVGNFGVKDLSFGVGTGFTQLYGKENTDILRMIPIQLILKYNFSIVEYFSIGLSFGAGVMYNRLTYASGSSGNVVKEIEYKPLLQPGLLFTFSLIDLIKFHIGSNFPMLVQNNNVSAMISINMGFSMNFNL